MRAPDMKLTHLPAAGGFAVLAARRRRRGPVPPELLAQLRDPGLLLRRQQRVDLRHQLRVRDEGAGVPEATLADIFRPFYRMDDSRARETGGTGLWLAITERAVRLHGGTVTAANVPGGGFVVEIRLPVA